MALFDYKCDPCDYVAYDVFFREGEVVTCPKCGQEMRKCFGAMSFKIHGYSYNNVYKNNKLGSAPTLQQMGLKK